MKRTRFALFSAVALVAAAAVGCSSSGSSPAATASASPGSANFGVNATGTVQFWARTVSKTLAQKLVSEFNATHTNLKVKLTLTSINDDTTSLATSARDPSERDCADAKGDQRRAARADDRPYRERGKRDVVPSCMIDRAPGENNLEHDREHHERREERRTPHVACTA